MHTSQYSYITNYKISPEYIEYVHIDNNNIYIQKTPYTNTPYDIESQLHYTNLFLTNQLSPNLSYNPFKDAWKDNFTFYNYNFEIPINQTEYLYDNESYTITNDTNELEYDNEITHYSSSSESDDEEWNTI